MLTRMDATPEFCRAALRYEPETGKLYWRKRAPSLFKYPCRAETWNARFAGEEAFRVRDAKWGHKTGTIGGRVLKAHVVIWAIVHGEWPKGQIDHINGDPSDNRICNLRDVTGSVNVRNSSRYKSNKSGVVGVCWSNTRRHWIATINDKTGRQLYLGSFHDLSSAAAVRKAAEAAHGYHPNHGRVAA